MFHRRQKYTRRTDPVGPVSGMLLTTAAIITFLVAALGSWMIIVGLMLMVLMFIGSFADAKY